MFGVGDRITHRAFAEPEREGASQAISDWSVTVLTLSAIAKENNFSVTLRMTISLLNMVLRLQASQPVSRHG